MAYQKIRHKATGTDLIVHKEFFKSFPGLIKVRTPFFFLFPVSLNYIFKLHSTLSQTTNFRLFQSERHFADDHIKFDENGRKFFKRVENTVGKGAIARYEQFLLFLQCFQKACTADT